MSIRKLNDKCYTCGKDSHFSILLAITEGRIYLPNQKVREANNECPHPGYVEVSFCKKCIRSIEDSLRATILYLQTENGITPPIEP